MLPPWPASDVNKSETMEETNKVEPEKDEVTTHLSTEEQVEVPADENTTDKGTREVEGSPGNIPVYSTIENVSNQPATSAQEDLQEQPKQSVLPETGSKDSASKETEEKENNDVYETVLPPQPLRPAPPKPLPYSLTKKLSKTAGDGGGEKLMEKVKK